MAAIQYPIKNIPTAIAILDAKLNFIDYSEQWITNFTSIKKDITGKHLFDSLIEIPIEFKETVTYCLKGNTDINKGKLFKLPNRKGQWLKWKIIPFDNGKKKIAGLMIVLEDCSDDKRELELLHKAEAVAKIGGWEVDLIKNTIYWTQATRDIHEVDDDFIPDLEKGINFYKEGDSRERISKLVQLAIEEGRPWDTELIIITAKGNEVWVRTKGEAEIIDKKVTRIFGTFQDIDQAKKAELEYRKISERLKVATDTAKIGIWEYIVEENQLFWDTNMYDLYKVNKDDFTGVYEAWEASVHPDDKEHRGKEIEDAISNDKNFNTEFRVLWPNGEVRNIRAIAKTVKDTNGKTIKLIGANWDITELKSTKLQLARSVESFNDTFDSVAIGMAVISPNFQWLKVNKSLTYTLGYSEKELLKLTTLDLTHPDDLVKSKQLYQDAFNAKQDNYQTEKRYIHKNGHIVHFLVLVTIVKKLNGEPLHAIAQFIDITARVEVENKLQALLEVAKTQNDSLMNFAHIVSHNLRSHATNLNMLTNCLLTEEDEEERENMSNMFSNAVESLGETIKHLNDVVQAKASAQDNLKRVNVLKIIEQIKHSVVGLMEQENAKLTINVSPLHFVHAIPSYLESAFLNLLTNALKYRSVDRSPVIDIKSDIVENNVRITVSDNGTGIDLKRHGEKVFGMYKTFHRNKDAKGIGLFITKNQIEAMNGTITLESELDQGTTFFIQLKQEENS